MKPWMTWLKLYQSAMCCEFCELATAPCQSLISPQRQIGARPISHRTAAASAMMAAILTQCCRLMPIRSEEHTSELQSLMRISYAVFCSKKKTTHTSTTQHTKKPKTQHARE